MIYKNSIVEISVTFTKFNLLDIKLFQIQHKVIQSNWVPKSEKLSLCVHIVPSAGKTTPDFI